MKTSPALTVATTFTALVGLFMSLLTLAGGIAWLKQSLGSIAAEMDGERFAFGIAGALLVGWAISMGTVNCSPRTRLSANLAALLAWFVLDSCVSFVAGFPSNVVGNVGFLAILGLPLWRMRQGANETRHGTEGDPKVG